MKTVRIGIAGLGMGTLHANNILSGQIPRLELAAVADMDEARRAAFPGVKGFATAEEMIGSGLIDAILVATPHYSHTPIGIAALQAGLHVMMEKPLVVHKAEARRLLDAHTGKKQVFAVMFNQRTDPYYRKIREYIRNGDLGEVRRVNWIVTDWFRTEAYYASSAWRATWKGEGGGVLLNQCPHNLDMLQWLFGLPARVRAHAGFGRYHRIEVEDDVTAYIEFSNGATGVFVASTGEAPGTNRLEITGERGRVVYENDRITFTQNAAPMTQFSRVTAEAFARPATTEHVFDAPDHGEQHAGILKNFTGAILDGEKLIAPASEGLASVEIANAMLLSAWLDKDIPFPLDAELYEKMLNQRIAISSAPKVRKTVVNQPDFSKSFRR
ncbi:Gfo/Idh/MocA family oxidoreductase [Termitidicoccus mucosus]|uniref:Oxidoreductase n=1 Tax=Termitidicoccus mucosus TaxID=1184151 RepID=A0A178IJB3_9BACT|nr:oxidoreductase [Opitutaceae bacterium TSB47]